METIAQFFEKNIKLREEDIVNFIFNYINKSKKSFSKNACIFFFEMGYTLVSANVLRKN